MIGIFPQQKRQTRGFTLVELLIALAILGAISTFTIPKILQSQQDNRNKAIVKEAAALVSQAFYLYQTQTGITASTRIDDVLATKVNYIKLKTTGFINQRPTISPDIDCSLTGFYKCYTLANGAVLAHGMGGGMYDQWGGTSPNFFVLFTIDPTGTQDGVQSVEFFLTADGRVRTRGDNDGNAALDPAWFSWN